MKDNINVLYSLSQSRSRRIKTIVKHYTQAAEFDTLVNDAIKDGWKIDEIKITSSDSLIMLFALFHRFEGEESVDGTKKGEWLKTDAYPHHVYCSECYKTYVTNEEVIDGRGGSRTYCTEAEFCPHCGVRMETEQEATENV